MIKLWYNMQGDAETPEYFIYDDKLRVGWVKNIDDDGYIDEIMIYPKYRNMGYGREALRCLSNLLKRDLILDVNRTNIQAIKCYENVGFIDAANAWHHNKEIYKGMILKYE